MSARGGGQKAALHRSSMHILQGGLDDPRVIELLHTT